MPAELPSASGIRDNRPKRGTVAEFLKDKIGDGAALSFVSAYFTIYAYEALKETLLRAGSLRFLFGEPSFVQGLDPSKKQQKIFRIEDDQLALANRLEQKRIARECADWIRDKVDIRTVNREGFLHGKMYHIENGGSEDAILGSSNFTVRGLGLATSGNNIELNLEVDSSRDRRDLKAWFDELWDDDSLVKDVKNEVLSYLEQLYQNHSPEFVYYKTLFHLFEKFLDDSGKTTEELGQTTLFETGIWQALYKFQQDGVKGAVNKILKHNGCILADSVGLGKTYEALAVIKYFELRNERVLVLCPKKLRENWTVYKLNDQLNPFGNDRFRYDVLSHTDLSREKGKTGDIDLETLNWANYDLVVTTSSKPASKRRFFFFRPLRSTTTSATCAIRSTSSPRAVIPPFRKASASDISARHYAAPRRISQTGRSRHLPSASSAISSTASARTSSNSSTNSPSPARANTSKNTTPRRLRNSAVSRNAKSRSPWLRTSTSSDAFFPTTR